jgi:hypothetical protein
VIDNKKAELPGFFVIMQQHFFEINPYLFGEHSNNNLKNHRAVVIVKLFNQVHLLNA